MESIRAHAQFCVSGDETVAAVRRGRENVAARLRAGGGGGGGDRDRGLVIVASDANLRRYGISPKEIDEALGGTGGEGDGDGDVEAHIVFISSVGEQAEAIRREVRPGLAHVALDVSDLPSVFSRILTNEASSS